MCHLQSKTNIDVAGFHTTAACKEVQYLATQDAVVAAKPKKQELWLVKPTLDQFATDWLVFAPYGAVKNSFNPEYISGGSSSGSSVVVANGIVPFSLGTDTAGQGVYLRVITILWALSRQRAGFLPQV